MSNLAEVLGGPQGRYDHVEAAYDGLSPENKAVFREAITDKQYGHAQIATALRALGYDVDRKQVQHFREKVSLGKVEL